MRTLEVRGWVPGSLDSGDRRRHLVQITPRGKAVVDAAQAAQRHRLEQLLQHLTPQEREQLVALALRMATMLVNNPAALIKEEVDLEQYVPRSGDFRANMARARSLCRRWAVSI